MRRFLYDTAVFVYAQGRDHPLREPCREIVARAARGELRGEASADLIQELAHQRHRRTGDRHEAVAAARDAAALCTVHEVTREDALQGLDLFRAHEGLDARDAVFAAVAVRRGIEAILTSDRAFDAIPGLERVDPADVASVSALAGR